MSLLIVGTVAFDKIETPYGKTDPILGGAATYIGIASSYFQKDINLISVVGDDFPKKYIKVLHDHNINTSGLQTIKGSKTFFWEGKYHKNINNRDTISTELNVLTKFEPTIPNEYQNCDFLMLGNLDPSIQIKVLSQLKAKPKLVVMDTMNYWMDNSWKPLLNTIKSVDVLCINEEEARQLSREFSLLKAAQKILSMGPKFLIIKKGEHGALLFNQTKNCFFAPAFPLETVFDPTGAGDTFAGGFIGYLSKTNDISFENMKSAILYGAVLASLTVEKFGTTKIAYLNKKEINNRIKYFQEMIISKINTI